MGRALRLPAFPIRWVGPSFVVVAVGGLVAPRSLAISVPAVMLLLVAAFKRRLNFAAYGTVAGCLAFTVWAVLSATWSPDPQASLLKSLYLAGLVALVGLTCSSMQGLPLDQGRRTIRWICLGGLVVCGILAAEVISGQVFARVVLELLGAPPGKHVHIIDGRIRLSEAEVNRRTAFAALLVVPTLVAAGISLTGTARTIATSMILAAVLAILICSSHESSKVALAAGILALLLACLSDVVARYALITAWLLATVAVVPIVIWLHSQALHEADWLFHSARHRVVIWNHTAQEVIKHPFFGIGADATPEVQAGVALTPTEAASRSPIGPETARHAHNAFLQVWYELGAVGAALWGISGIVLLNVIGSGKVPWRVPLLVQFSVTFGMILSSYSIWQPWFLAAIALTGTLTYWVARVACDRAGGRTG